MLRNRDVRIVCCNQLYCRMRFRIIMTSSNGNIFRVTGPLCGEFAGHRSFPLTKASDAELWCFLDLRRNKRLTKQSWGWWFEMPSHSLWRLCYDHRCLEQLVVKFAIAATRFILKEEISLLENHMPFRPHEQLLLERWDHCKSGLMEWGH